MPPPSEPKIYHILHVDRLSSIIDDGNLWCDAEIARRQTVNPDTGTTIGLSSIKQRRLTRLTLASHPGLHVGQCVPFYFCPRSVMLYVISQANHAELEYHGGQRPIIHLEADLRQSVAWADRNGRRWAFTLSNAGAHYFEDRSDLAQLREIDWEAVQAVRWAGSGISPSVMEGKQAEFLMEQSFPWELVSRIGVRSPQVREQVRELLTKAEHQPHVEIMPGWYY
jgi:hypothetical protein